MAGQNDDFVKFMLKKAKEKNDTPAPQKRFADTSNMKEVEDVTLQIRDRLQKKKI